MAPTSPCAFLQPTARALAIAPPQPATLLPGERLGVWRIDAPLGSTTYAVTRVDSDRQAVLHEIDAPPLISGSYAESLTRTVERLQTLVHPAIAEIYDCGTLGDGRPYIVLEKLEGVMLSLRIAEGRLNADDAIEILLDICAPLAIAHAAGVAHRHLAPETVLLVDDDRTRVKLLDWGIAADIAHEAKQADRVMWTTAASGGPALGPEDDIAALGELALAMLHEQPPDELVDLIVAMRAPDPRDRPTIDVVRAQLDELHAGNAIERLEPPPATRLVADDELESERPHEKDPEEQGWRVSVATIAAICIVLAIVIAGIARSHASQPEGATPRPAQPEKVVPKVLQTAVAPAAPIVQAAARIETAPVHAKARSVVAPARPTKPAGKPAVQGPSSDEVIAQFQRVGHELLQLQQRSGDDATAALWPKFRAIDLDAALVTPASRKAALALLSELHQAATQTTPTEP